MVRGNWQKRVETAEARRAVAKQRKQRRDNKGAFKAMVHEFLALMDPYSDALLDRTLHVWTDTMPSDSSPPPVVYNEGDYYQEGKPKRRSKASGNKKKSHPRSHQEQEDEESSTVAPRLCRTHFFTGKCKDEHRKSACRHVHYGRDEETLCSILGNNKSLLESQESVASSDTDVDDGAMDMLYHVSVTIGSDEAKPGVEDEKSDAKRVSVTDAVSKVFSKKSCGLASIVYAAMDNVLLFDRYQGGSVVSQEEFEETFLGARRKRSTENIGTSSDSTEPTDAEHPIVAMLPATTLEHILTFLPDVYVAAMCKVCKSWNREIGTTSPALWKHLLQRRNWPIPVESEIERDAFRSSFLSHYSVVRDMQAIQAGVSTLMGRKVVEEKEMVLQAFSTRRGAPQTSNRCIGVKVFSPERVLAAYSEDGTLRLFEAVAKPVSDSGNCPRGCREVVCVRMLPYKSVKKRYCQLLSFDTDDELIGCLWSVEQMKESVMDVAVAGGEDLVVTYILTVVSREDFLCAGGSNNDGSWDLPDNTVNTIDICEAVRKHLLDDLEESMLRDFLDDDFTAVCISVSSNVLACGNGRFVVEVAFSIPFTVDGDAVDSVEHRKVVLFSATGTVLWIGEFFPNHDDDEVRLVRLEQLDASGSRTSSCTVALCISQWIQLAVIDATGQVELLRLMEFTELYGSEILDDDWERSTPFVVASVPDLVVAHNLSRQTAVVGTYEQKTLISFHPRTTLDGHGTGSMVHWEEDCRVFGMQCLGDNHVVVIYSENETSSDDGEIGMEPLAFFAFFAVVLHIPTRREIQRTHLYGNRHFLSPCSFFPFLSASGDTVGFGLGSVGMIMTGNDIRSIGEDTGREEDSGKNTSSVKKKKKKRQFNKGSKKDGFARGMSLRG